MSGLIPAEFIEKVKEANDIETVVSAYVDLSKKSSHNLFGLCPFHHEDTPSFSVSPAKSMFYCFGCGAGGDVIKFIMNIENLTYVEAIKFLAKRASIPLPELDNNSEFNKKQKYNNFLRKLNAMSANFYYKSLRSKNALNLHRYLKERSLNGDCANKFALGYAPAGWTSLVDYFKQEFPDNTPYKELISLGLIKEKNGRYYDIFRERLIFPILDAQKNVIAFGARILPEKYIISPETANNDFQAKYLNSSETPIYHKGDNLYGIHLAKKSDLPYFVVVEGYMDAIALHAAGIDSAVAVLGTALTVAQIKLMKRYKEHLILCFDADDAGKKATLRALELLRNDSLNVKVISLPQQKDPDSYLQKHGVFSFQNLLDKALSPLDYYYEMFLNQDRRDKRFNVFDFCQHFLEILVKYDISAVERSSYFSRITLDCNISKSDLESDFKRLLKNGIQSSPKFEVDKSYELVHKFKDFTDKDDLINENAPISSEELKVFNLILSDSALVFSLDIKLKEEDFLSLASKKFYREILDKVKLQRESNSILLSDLIERAALYNFRNGNLKTLLLQMQFSLPKLRLDKKSAQIILLHLKIKSLSEFIMNLSNDNRAENEKQLKNSVSLRIKYQQILTDLMEW